jgi:hypothetical protein
MSFDSREMSRRGRLGALTTLSRYGPTEINAKARATFIERFIAGARAEAEARGETITDAEAARRGEFARRAWYTRLAQRSVVARRRRARSTPTAETAA